MLDLVEKERAWRREKGLGVAKAVMSFRRFSSCWKSPEIVI